jgi:4-hydroxybenzoyl-CoA thioesterase/acyl-CoA thioester hydrolase
MYEFHTKRRIEFADTDMAGIVHFARFFVFMESAEHEFLRTLGSTVHFEHEGQHIGWPRVATSCEFRSPARLGDVLDIHLRVLRKGGRSLTWSFLLTCEGRLVAEGKITSICCVLPTPYPKSDGKLRPVPIPDFLADQIEEAPKESANGKPSASRT